MDEVGEGWALGGMRTAGVSINGMRIGKTPTVLQSSEATPTGALSSAHSPASPHHEPFTPHHSTYEATHHEAAHVAIGR